MNFVVEIITREAAEELAFKMLADLECDLSELDDNINVNQVVNFSIKIDHEYVALLKVNCTYQIANLSWIFVKPQFRRKNIGRTLVKAAVDHFKNELISAYAFKDSIYKSNTILFYKALGFEPAYDICSKNHEYSIVAMLKRNSTPLEDLIKIEHEARNFGFDWPNYQEIIEQAISECAEIKEAIQNKEPLNRVGEEMGDLLHTAVSLCVFYGFDCDDVLRKIVIKFSSRMNAVKMIAKEKGLDTLKGKSFDFMLSLWKEAKLKEKKD